MLELGLYLGSANEREEVSSSLALAHKEHNKKMNQ